MQADTPMKRRCRLSALMIGERGKSTRRGVRLKTAPKVQIAISPDTCRSRSIGFAPSWLVSAGTMRRQTPIPMRTMSANILLPRILAASPRESNEGRGDEDIARQNSRVRTQELQEFRSSEKYLWLVRILLLSD